MNAAERRSCTSRSSLYLVRPAQVFVIFALTSSTWGKTGVAKYDDLEIRPGTHRCVSDCVYVSTETDKLLSCSADDYDYSTTGYTKAQSYGIDEMYLETFADEEDLVRLALHFKWSSDVSASHAKECLINVTNGETSYLKCCDVKALVNQSSSKRGFYHDCFGKEKETIIRTGSTITIEITSLQREKSNPELEKYVAVVEVPDCTNSDLHVLEECQTRDEDQSKPVCQENCDTFSIVDDITYPISCSSSEPRGLCPETNRTVIGAPSLPKIKNKAWYTYVDQETEEVKLALNFSWTTRGDSSIRTLAGYYFAISSFPNSGTSSFSKCYSIHTDLNETQHSEAEFFYDCYGREGGSEVNPDTTYSVALHSRDTERVYVENELFFIDVPACADEGLHDVTKCKKHDKFITSDVEHIYCENRTVRYSYNVSSEFGSAAEVRFCEEGSSPGQCKNLLPPVQENLQLAGTLYNLSLQSTANLTIPYVIVVNGDKYFTEKDYARPNFTDCVRQDPVPVSEVAVALTCVAVILFALTMVFFLWFCFFRHKCGFWVFKRLHPPPPEIHVSLPLPPDIAGPASFPESVRTYVVFAEDHELHTNVVHCFCSYLARVLGIEVRVHIWEENDAAANRPEYMIKNLNEADRVIVICSEGTKNALNSDEERMDNMYAPVIRRIVTDLLVAKNPDKYLIAHFEYGSLDHVPNTLQDHIHGYSSVYHLMRDLEKFYFRMVGVEQRQEGGIIIIDRIKQYFVPEERSDCGRNLDSAITKMSTFVRENPTWYTDLCRPDGTVYDVPALFLNPI